MKAERGPWFWILSGCGCLLLVGLLVVAALVWAGARVAGDVRSQLEDPERRRDTAAAVLGGLPAGYEVELALSIPLVGELAGLETGDGRSLLVMRSRLLRTSDGGFDTGQFEVMAGQQGFMVDRRDRLAGGRLAPGRYEVEWAAYRGRFGEAGRERRSTMTLIGFECPVADRLGRMALWIEPLASDPETDPPALDGTVADPAQIEALLRQIDPCPPPA